MRAELKAKWIAALRSGEYKQTTGCLHRPAENAYCCLGVLAELQGFALVNSIGSYDELAIDDYSRSLCIDLNDSQHKSFPEIADWIEEHVLVDGPSLPRPAMLEEDNAD